MIRRPILAVILPVVLLGGLVLGIFCRGATTNQKTQSGNVSDRMHLSDGADERDVIRYLQEIDNQVRPGEAFNSAKARVFEKAYRGLETLTYLGGVQRVFRIAYQADPVNRKVPATQPVPRNQVNVFYVARFAAIFRLGKINTRESALQLWEIIRDDKIRFTDEEKLNLGQAVTKSGVRCLYYLKGIQEDPLPPNHPQYVFVQELIDCIRNGRIYIQDRPFSELTPQTINHYIDSIDIQAHFWECYEDYAEDRPNTAFARIATAIRGMKSGSHLKDIYYAVSRYWEKRSTQDYYRQVGAPGFHLSELAIRVKYEILYRLAELKTDESAKALVDIMADASVSHDAHNGETMVDAAVRCGKPCLAHLKQCLASNPTSPAVRGVIGMAIAFINEGRKSGF
jgi:hypothetical protein